MIEFILSVIGAVIMGAVTYLSSTTLRIKTARHFNRMKKERALARLQQEPHYRIGAVIKCAWQPGTEVGFISDYYIAEMSVGRVLLKTLDDKEGLVMTAVDFEDLHVLVALGEFHDSKT